MSVKRPDGWGRAAKSCADRGRVAPFGTGRISARPRVMPVTIRHAVTVGPFRR
jgi:hypothetical protein